MMPPAPPPAPPPLPPPLLSTGAARASAEGDQEGGGGPTYPPVQQGIPAALADGSVTLAQLETAVRRLMRVRLLLGMFDPPASNPYNAITHDAVASPANLALATESALQGLVLLRNDGALLPLAAGRRLAVVGPFANLSSIAVRPSQNSYAARPATLTRIPAIARPAGQLL